MDFYKVPIGFALSFDAAYFNTFPSAPSFILKFKYYSIRIMLNFTL